MSADWSRAKLGDLITLQSGSTPSKKDETLWNGQNFWASAKDLKSFYIESTIDKLTPAGVRKSSRVVEAGTTLILTRGMTLINDVPICVVKNQASFNQDLKAVVPKRNDILAGFIPYLLLANKQRIHGLVDLAGHGTGRLATDSLLNLEVMLPPEELRQNSVDLFKALDDKILLNHQINQTLEQMAQAIFKSWFVDFEPVKAKIAALEAGGSAADAERAAMRAISGKDADQLFRMQSEQLEQYADLHATAALFPAAMQESELGEVPEGWEVSQLGDCLDTLETGARPKGGVKSITDGVPSVGAENILGVGNYQYGKEKFVPHEFFDKLKRGIVEHLDCLLYKDGGKPGDFRPRVSMFGCEFPYDRFAINEHVFRLRSERLGQPFLYFQIGHERVLAELRHRGAKAAIPGINRKDVKTIWVVCPSPKVLGAFNNTVEGMLSSILTRSKENLRLSGLRDALLPKLLSGELTLPEAEAPLPEAAHA